MPAIIIRPWRNVASCDPDPRDARIIEHDAEEGQVSIAGRGRDETAEYHPTVLVEVLDQRAGMTVSVLPARPAAIWLVNVCEDCAKAPGRCWDTAIGTWDKEQSVGDVATHRGE